jgi:hypothetical protein
MPADQVVLTANGRCDQENLVAQLKGGVHALATPVDDLVSNWAYMVMASLAWSLKAEVPPQHVYTGADVSYAPGALSEGAHR